MKKAASIVFIAGVLFLCLLPSAGMLIFGESQGGANEIQASRPSLMTEEGRLNPDFPAELTDYFADRFAFRQQCITADAALKAAVFHESAAEDVILGKKDQTGDWLYYAKTKNDWLHADTLSQGQVRNIAHTLALAQEYARSQGAVPVFTVAPNKNSIYPDYMPYQGNPPGQPKNLELLTEALAEEGVSYADLTQTLYRAARQEENAGTDPADTLYHRLDSHWTARGAALGMQCIMKALGTEGRDWSREPYTLKQVHKGDLYEMLFPVGKKLDYDAVYQRKPDFSYLQEETAADGSTVYRSTGLRYGDDGAPRYDSLRIDTKSGGPVAGRLLMFRDSFGNALYPFLADSFRRATFSRQLPWRLDWLLQDDGDEIRYVVMEIVERNLGDLAVKAPVMPAPERTPPAGNISRETAGTLSADLRAEVSAELTGYVKVTGQAGASGDAVRGFQVYLQAGDRIFEASPVGEGPDGQGGNGCFTAFLPEEVLKEQSVSVILWDKSEFYVSGPEVLSYE